MAARLVLVRLAMPVGLLLSACTTLGPDFRLPPVPWVAGELRGPVDGSILELLDRIEGSGFDAPGGLFRRRLVTVEAADHRVEHARVHALAGDGITRESKATTARPKLRVRAAGVNDSRRSTGNRR
jgi:hypothetical protein